MQQENKHLLKDSEWSVIDSEICRVTDFVPLGSSVQDGKVIAFDMTTPYASIVIECKKIPQKITGFITNKLDFTNLWNAFKERGINKEKEEVIIIWSRKHYKSKIAKLLSATMPKIFVMVCPKGTYESCPGGGKWSSRDEALLIVYSLESLSWWIPDVIK